MRVHLTACVRACMRACGPVFVCVAVSVCVCVCVRMLRVSERGWLSCVLHARLYMGVCVLVVCPHSAKSAKSRTAHPSLPRERKRSAGGQSLRTQAQHLYREGNATQTSDGLALLPWREGLASQDPCRESGSAMLFSMVLCRLARSFQRTHARLDRVAGHGTTELILLMTDSD
jgi:hypothetical protein